MTSPWYVIELQTVEACLTSALCALRLAWRSIAEGDLEDARRWTARAEASCLFAAGVLTALSSGSGRARLRAGRG